MWTSPTYRSLTLWLTMVFLAGRCCRMAKGFGSLSSVRTKTSSRLAVLAEPIATKSKHTNDEVMDPLIVCGPSGVGKGTIIAKFMEELGGKDLFQFTVSHTTRAPREGEIDGVHYHFIEKDSMKQAIAENAFLEHAEVHGNIYGTSWSSLRDVQEEGGRRCLLDIDAQGVKNIKTMESDTMKPKYVFIAPPSLKVLEKRLIGRGTESPKSLAQRTANARAEFEYGVEHGNFDVIVVNDDLDLACKTFARVVTDLYSF